jgi:DnaJ-class molecular chaperone
MSKKVVAYLETACKNCNGKGKYEVHNAYDENYIQLVVCEMCSGSGVRLLPVKSEVKDSKVN